MIYEVCVILKVSCSMICAFMSYINHMSALAIYATAMLWCMLCLNLDCSLAIHGAVASQSRSVIEYVVVVPR